MSDFIQPGLSENALTTLQARYLWKDSSGRVVETPQEMFRRVASTVARVEHAYGANSSAVEAVEKDFYDAMACGKYFPNSPTLMNAGRSLGVLSACFVLPLEDSVEGIFDTIKLAAQIQKAGGGTGFSFDRLRPTDDFIASSGGKTSGPISFWKVLCEATRAIQQGAFRRGANMGMMSVDHPDILKFIAAKGDLSMFENFNISVKVTNEFFHRLRDEASSPHVVINRRTHRRYWLPKSLDVSRYGLDSLLPADGAPPRDVCTRQDVWDRVIHGAWDTGEPGVCFIDRVNEDNPTPSLGRIEATNPCGEQPLLDYEACNLGSIDVSKFVRDAALDEEAFRSMVRLGVRFLDDVIDAANYVSPAIEEICRGNRKIGLGVMGLADAMFEMGIRYDSDEGLAFGRRIAELFTREAYAASEALARQRGEFPNYTASLWQTKHSRPMRNAAVTTIAPTGTLSILAGCSGGIEPAFALAFVRHVLDGAELREVNSPFRRYAQARGFWSDELAGRLARGEGLESVCGDSRAKEIFVTAHEVAPQWHVRMQAEFQKYIDGAISKTINLPSAATPQDVDAVYRMAFELRCKGVTVYRDGCRAGQPMTTRAGEGVCPRCHAPMSDEGGCARCTRCGATLCS